MAAPHIAWLRPFDAARPQPGREADLEAERAEEAALTAYVIHLAAAGHRVLRHRVVTGPPLPSTDLFDATSGELVMAWHHTSYRMRVPVIGIFADCERLFPHPKHVLLLTTPPDAPTLDFLRLHGITGVWREGDTFQRTEPTTGERR